MESQQPTIADADVPHLGTLDYAAPQTPNADDASQQQAAASTWSESLNASAIPNDLSAVGDLAGATAEAVGTAAEVTVEATTAIGESICGVVVGILEGLGSL